jgi:arylsulfatase A-like enzyme
MNDHPSVTTEELTEPKVVAAAIKTLPEGAGPGTVLLVALWIGLIAGFLDLGLLYVNRRLINHDFYRVGDDFTWLIPTGVAVLVVVPAIAIALLAWMKRRGISLAVAVWALSCIGLLDVCARLPVDPWAALLLSAGFATQSVRMVRPRRAAFVRLVRRSVPVLAGILVTIMLVTIGRRAWTEVRAASALPPAPAGARNVLLIVWDTVRASNLSLYGYGRPTTPNLEGLSRRGVRFDLAFSSASWTLPSHASMFTGRWPHELGVDWKSPVRSDVPTLAEYLGSRGYDTAGFAANVDYCSRETGLARGMVHYEDFPLDVYDVFSRYVALGQRIEVSSWVFLADALVEKCLGRWYDLVPRSREHVKNAEAVDRAFLAWLGHRRERARPFFAFLNYNDAHSPYEVPDRSQQGIGLRPTTSGDRQALALWNSLDKARLAYRNVQMAGDLYDDCISHLDRRLGMLLAELDRCGVLADTLVIVTADHGEHLGDHLLFFHGCSLYRQLVQVPLVIFDSKSVSSSRAVAEPVSLCDLPATVVDLLGLGRDAPFPGRSLRQFWERPDKAALTPNEPLLMETGKPELLVNQGREPAAKGPMKSLIARGMHYIRSADGHEELYRLSYDPEERADVAGSPEARSILERFRETLVLMRKRGKRD